MQHISKRRTKRDKTKTHILKVLEKKEKNNKNDNDNDNNNDDDEKPQTKRMISAMSQMSDSYHI